MYVLFSDARSRVTPRQPVRATVRDSRFVTAVTRNSRFPFQHSFVDIRTVKSLVLGTANLFFRHATLSLFHDTVKNTPRVYCLRELYTV